MRGSAGQASSEVFSQGPVLEVHLARWRDSKEGDRRLVPGKAGNIFASTRALPRNTMGRHWKALGTRASRADSDSKGAAQPGRPNQGSTDASRKKS